MLKYAVFALLTLGVCLAGCEKTAQAAKEDTTATMDATMTPKIKSAIIANPILNDPDNLVDVETSGETVYLRGHVVSQEAKNEATQIAQRVLDEADSKFQLVNELEVVPVPKAEDKPTD